MKRIKYIIASLAALLLVTAPASLASAQIDIKGSFCTGTKVTGDPEVAGSVADCDTADDGVDVQSIAETIVNVFTWIVGVVAVIMIIYGGFRYITSGGDSGKVSGAKNAIIFALVGLVIVILAQIIIRFVVNQFDGTGPGN